jgi:DNA-binding FrmR family transcriptional regulator
MRSKDEEKIAAFSAALRRFPGHEQAIETMFHRNENFRDMCEELAEVDRTLACIDCVPVTVRDARVRECEEWIEQLSGEIGDALGRGNVISIGQFDSSKRRVT